MRLAAKIPFVLASVTLTLARTLHAQPANERVAFSLSGPNCAALHQSIDRTLERVPGVKRIDMRTVPDHILIDRTRNHLTAQDLQMIINKALPEGEQCRAEIMNSCITADRPSTPE